MTVILTKADLERMRATIRGPNADTTVADRKAELKRMSNERMKHWPNTLEAMRLKKESWLKDKADKEELERQEIDRQEAELRRVARLESIQKAHDLLFEQTDKVKHLRSQALYADVVYTRQQQAEERKRNKEKEKLGAQDYHQYLMQKVAEGDEEERRKQEKRRQAVEEVKHSRFEQREEARRTRELEQEKNRIAGQKIKEAAQEELQEELRTLERKQQLAAESNIRMIKANEEIKAQRAQIRAREEQAELEREKEIEAIDYRKSMLKHLAQQRFEKSQETRQMLIDRAVKQLAAQQNHEEAILQKQVADQIEKEEAKFAAKLARQEMIKQQLLESRTAQIEARERQQRQQFEEEDALLRKWTKENEEGIAQELEKAKQRKSETVRFKTMQYNDGKERAREKQEAKMLEIEQARYLQTAENADDVRFVALAKDIVEKNVKQGKPVYTILKALEYHQPELLPAKRVPVDKNKKKDD